MYLRIGLVIVAIVLVIGGFSYNMISNVISDKNQYEDQVRQWTKERTGITQIDQIDEYRGNKTYAVVIGKNQVGTPIVAWLTPDSVDFEILDGAVTKESVKTALEKGYKNPRIIHIVPGKDAKNKFWEAVFVDQENRYNYVYYDFWTGKVIKSYRLNAVTAAS
ncbi:DUF5590 domain-containing protein [Brevibacillus ginsengisoli]|uniref:cell wall elongation regulator TseB-like domain-containing protein n=1 Tax=Brevibacillus ginsengisoli TaxID=363854 RepID=UPI003CF2FD04